MLALTDEALARLAIGATRVAPPSRPLTRQGEMARSAA
jgi:hypothetical protein